ncbi:MAG: hypothetical protein Kow00121_27990 [Elainellaceae cyanobacterium]
MEEGLIQQKSFEFALSMIRLYRKLQARQEFVVSPNLLQSGTSIGVKVEQSMAEPDSQALIQKLVSATGTAREARYWLRLLQESRLTDIDVTPELYAVNDIIEILTRLVKDLKIN